MNLSEYYPWKSANVADLAFLLLSPSLIIKPVTSLILSKEQLFKWLKILDQDDSNLRQALVEKKVRKLGWYAEQLMTYFFTNYPTFKLLGNNIQLFNGKITTGEIDFIVEDLKTNKIIQIELATKFYLYYEKYKAENRLFIGPNARDNFDHKYHHLINQQLKKETPQEVLEITNGKPINQSYPWVKGVLFYPLKKSKTLNNLDFINPFHTKGWYCSLTDLLTNDKITELQVFKKMDWLGLSSPNMLLKQHFNDYFSTLINDGHKAIMVLNKKNERGFIMSNQWPD